MKLGLIGHGAIAQHLLRALDDGAMPGVSVPAILVRKPRAAAVGPREITNDPARFLRYGFDAVLECAGHDAVREHAERILAAGADLLVTSVGVFVDDALFARVQRAAEAAGCCFILPSAGIGLDRTRLIIIADPAIATHQVEIAARGAFGSFRFAEDVIPSVENPKTGRLVAMALVKTVRQLRSTLVVGA